MTNLSTSIEGDADTTQSQMLSLFPQGERQGCPLLPYILSLMEDEVRMQQREKEAEASNRLLDVRGHLVPEAEVVYIYLSPFLSLVSLSFSLEGGAHSLPLPTSTIGDL